MSFDECCTEPYGCWKDLRDAVVSLTAENERLRACLEAECVATGNEHQGRRAVEAALRMARAYVGGGEYEMVPEAAAPARTEGERPHYPHCLCVACEDRKRARTEAEQAVLDIGNAVLGMQVPEDLGGGFYFDETSRAKLGRLCERARRGLK